MRYKIIEERYFDTDGMMHSPKYFVKYRKSFLGFTYWVWVKENSNHDQRIIFMTISSARRFAERILCEGKPYDVITSTQIIEGECDEN